MQHTAVTSELDPAFDAGPRHAAVKGGAPQRTCVVTRRVGDASTMIRFVRSPEGHAVPDLKAVLPGRGAWVDATRDVVAKVEARHFARGFKKPTTVEPGLVDIVEDMLAESALGALAMARKAGTLLSGFTKIDAALREGEVRALHHVTDASEDGVRKLAQAVRATTALMEEAEVTATKVVVYRLFSTDELAGRLGVDNPVHVALTTTGPGAGAAKHAAGALARLAHYRSNGEGASP